MKAIDLLRHRVASAQGISVSLTFDDLDRIEAGVDETLRRVADSETVDAAATELDRLGQIQGLLATLCFRHGVTLTPRLRSLVHEFDRPDDVDLRASAFARIRAGEFI